MTAFSNSSASLHRAFSDGDQPSTEDVDICLREVARQVRRQYPTISDRDAEEIAADAISALFEASLARRSIAEPAAWLIGTAKNAANNRWKSQKRTVVAEPESINESAAFDDYSVSRLLDAIGNRQHVRRAIRWALDADDRTGIRVVIAWLAIYELAGAAPSLREVAERANVPHSTAAKAFERFGRYLAAADET